jgi:hypothetical protein
VTSDHHVDISSLFPGKDSESFHISCTKDTCKYFTIDKSTGDIYITSTTKNESFSRIKLSPIEYYSMASTVYTVASNEKLKEVS